MMLLVLAAEAVPVDAVSEQVFPILAVLLSLLAVAIPVALVIGLIVLAARLRRQGQRLEQVEARLAAIDGRQPTGQ